MTQRFPLPPVPRGSEEAQLKALYSYLFRLSETLNRFAENQEKPNNEKGKN